MKRSTLRRLFRCAGLCQLTLFTLGCAGRVSNEGDQQPEAEVEPRPEVKAEPSNQFSCAWSDSVRPMLAARVDGDVYFAYGDRLVQRVFSYDIPKDGYIIDLPQIVARQEFVASYAVIAPLGGRDHFEPFVEFVVLELDGSVRHHERRSFAWEGWGSDRALVANEQGRVALTLMEAQTNLTLVVDSSGARDLDGRFAGRGDPDDSGRMLVANYDSSSSADYWFLDITGGASTPARYASGAFNSSPAQVDGGLVYLSNSPPTVIAESANASNEFPMDVAGLADVPGASVFDYATPGWQHSGGWALFHLGGPSPEGSFYAAIQPSTQISRTFQLKPPNGYALPEDFWNPPAIDSSGRVLVELTRGLVHELHATRDGNHWERLGRPLTVSGYSSSLAEAGGAVVYDGSGTDNAAPDALPEYGAQFIGPQGGAGVELVRGGDNPTYADDVISPDGGCLATFRNGSIHVLEAADYGDSELDLHSTSQSAEMAWIPLR